MKRCLILLILLSGCVSPPGQDRITLLLAGHRVVYDSNPAMEGDFANTQSWLATGTTLYDAGPGLFGGVKEGRWKSERGLYCSTFSPRADAIWECWRVTTSDGGRRVRFKKTPWEVFEFRKTEYFGTFVE
jgi:hypothetical protein